MTDEAYEVKEAIWTAVHDLVDEMTKGLSEEDDEEVRQALTEQFRFWRRVGSYGGDKTAGDGGLVA
jgi:hypothetical protein